MNAPQPFRRSPWRPALILFLGAVSIADSQTRTQNISGVAGGGSGLFGISEPQGVKVDAQQVLRFREDDRTHRLREVRRTPIRGHAYLSLPRMFEVVRQKIQAGEPIPEEIRNLEGMVRLQYVFVHPHEHDLVIAGPAEQWNPKDPYRPLGTTTGQPVLQLEDLVVALRTLGPGRRNPPPFGCSIEITQPALDRVVAEGNTISQEILAASSRNPSLRWTESMMEDAAARIAQACGPQPIVIFGVEPDTHFAFTCLQADYLMKMLSLGHMKSPVRGIQAHATMRNKGKGIFNRWWFVEDYEPLLVSADRNSYEIRGQGIRVETSSRLPDGSNSGDPPSPSAAEFARQLTEHFPELAKAVPIFAELRNVADLGVLAALINVDRLDERVGWDVGWIQDPNQLPVPKVPVPQTAEALAAFHKVARSVDIALGGAQLTPASVVDPPNRRIDAAGDLSRAARSPDPDHWSILEK